MTALQKYFSVVLVFTILLSACTSSTNSNTPIAQPSATDKPSAEETATPAVSQLNVKKEALRGAQIKVWYPWFGAEASLFESQVAEFNQKNEWGIVVSTEGKENFTELYNQTTDALKDSD